MASTTAGEAVALRAELYAARRSAGALQKDLDAVTAERDRLLDGATAATSGHEGVQAAAEELQALRDSLDSEVAARKAAEEEAERIGLERQRLQKARDELALILLAVQQRASEAEEDQQRAEQQALAAVAELRQLQLQHQQTWQPADDSQQPSNLSAAPGAGLEHLLEAERNRNAALLTALSSAEAERDAARMETAGARQQLGLAGVSAFSNGPVQNGGLPNGPASAARSEASLDGVSEPEKALASLQHQVARLKASRDKLIAQVSIQLAETDRMSVESAALAQALDEAREAAGKWERQFQEALGQQERLKDLLEESALWQAGARHPGNASSTDAAQARAGDGDEKNDVDGAAVGAGKAAALPDSGAHLAALEQRYVQECARAAELDVQVRALCAELSRAAAVTGEVGRSVLPALAGVEARLSQALQLKAGR